MIQAVWIDIDNTLLDFDAYVQQALRDGFEHFGLKPYEPYMFEVFERINNALWDKIEKGTLDFEGLQQIRFNKVFGELGIAFDGVTFEHYFKERIWNSAILIPGTVEMLSYLSEKYILCTASNGPYTQQLHRLEQGGIAQYFEYHFISEDIGVSKPEKAFFERALARLNEGRAEPIAASACVMLGDSIRSDIAGGKSSGMKTIWFNRKGALNTSACQPDAQIDALEKIKEIL